MNLRLYQSAALDAVHAALSRDPVLVLPTGGGKTFVAAQLVAERGGRTLWLAHRRELIQQAARSLERLGLDVGTIMAGEATRPHAKVQVASIQTLRRRVYPDADLIVVDEAHHARASTLPGRPAARVGRPGGAAHRPGLPRELDVPAVPGAVRLPAARAPGPRVRPADDEPRHPHRDSPAVPRRGWGEGAPAGVGR